MAKIRIYDLAKELGKENKEIIKVLDPDGKKELKATNGLDEEQVRQVKNKLNPKTEDLQKNAGKTERKPENLNQNKEESPKKRIWTNKPEGQNQQKKVYTNDRNNNHGEKQQGNRNNDNRGRQQDRTQYAGRTNRNDRNNNRGGDRNFRNNDRNGERSNGVRNNGENRDNNRRYGNKPGDRNGNGNNRNDRNDRNNNRGGDRNFRNNDRNNDRNNNNGRSFGGRNNDNRGGRGGFKRDNREMMPDTSADALVAERAKKEREDKLRFDRQERNKNNYTDGKGKKSAKGEKLPVLQKPTKEKKEAPEETIKVITIPEVLTIRDLAEKMKMQPSALVKKLFMQGKMVTLNTEIDYETAEEIALDYDIICEQEVKVDVIEEMLREDEDAESTLVPRPPVVCVMGHVDHGKTSLLDAIRKTNVLQGEAGGITQHIGAYTVSAKGKQITFLDTPGHEAFTAMRMRGAQATDIAILVVAADDGVMPQTIEAINHAKAAGIEIIVAVNKIDKPAANIERVKQELSEYELIAEDWGGSTVFVPVSAKTGEGIDELLEMIILQAEILELRANPNRRARGLVIEAKLDKGKGSVATVLVQKGTLHVGDPISAGASYGKVRAMIDDKGRRIKEAKPSTPVEILGLNGVPDAGEIVVAAENEKDARTFAETFISEGRQKMLEGTKVRMSLDDLYTQIQAGDVKELEIIVKADVQGSVEAVKQSLTKLSNEEVVVKVIHGGVGAITESDVSLASASNAIIIGFNVRPDNQAKEIAEKEGVDIRLYRVIYQAIEDVEAAMKGLLDPIYEEKVIGHAEVRQLFKASGVGTIAGSYVLDGSFQRGCSVRITREKDLIFEGPLASLKRFKDDVKEVKAGYECGLVFEKFNDLQEGDQIEAYMMVEVPR